MNEVFFSRSDRSNYYPCRYEFYCLRNGYDVVSMSRAFFFLLDTQRSLRVDTQACSLGMATAAPLIVLNLLSTLALLIPRQRG